MDPASEPLLGQTSSYEDKGKGKEPNYDPQPTTDPSSLAPAVSDASATAAPAFKVFKPPTGPSTALRNTPDIGDGLQPTNSEIHSAFQAQSRRSEALNNAPLRTKAMRDAEENKRLARWPTTTIRVKFPDLTQLERSFPSTDKIKAVYAFVRDSLADEMKPNKFVLYQSPPRRELKNSDPEVRDLSLAQLQLAPSSILLLNFLEPRFNASTFPAPLRPDMLALAQDLQAPPAFDPTITPAKETGKKLGSGSGLTGDKKIPKWLKLPGGKQ